MGQALKLRDAAPQRRDIVAYQDQLRGALFDGITSADVQQIVQGMVARAKKGDAAAIKMLFDYVLQSKGPIQIRDSQVLIEGRGRPAAPVAEHVAAPIRQAKLPALIERAAAGQALFDGEMGGQR